MSRESILQLDGAQGEGGGQILRSALTLSMLSGRPFRIERIRANRSKPGLMRQHLTCVRAAAAISQAQVDGDEIGATSLTFRPGRVQGTDYRFSVGSAGSTMLVLQTILPALLRADRPSTVRLEGGTHNACAPSSDFIADGFLPVLHRMGAGVAMTVERPGFYPAGGGQVDVAISPSSLVPLSLLARDRQAGIDATAALRGLPGHIGERELAVVQRRFPAATVRLRAMPDTHGPGNALVLRARHGEHATVVVGLGAHGVTAESVAEHACDELQQFLAHGAPIDGHLADQLLLPLVLAGSGEFVTGRPSEHLRTNAAVIEAFGAARIEIAPDDSEPQHRYRVTVRTSQDGLSKAKPIDGWQ